MIHAISLHEGLSHPIHLVIAEQPRRADAAALQEAKNIRLEHPLDAFPVITTTVGIICWQGINDRGESVGLSREDEAQRGDVDMVKVNEVRWRRRPRFIARSLKDVTGAAGLSTDCRRRLAQSTAVRQLALELWQGVHLSISKDVTT